ncbi:MAG: phospho-sugar mutase [Oscillospiraceae bacterium]|nr:phospho-sugar mutase [Oscillospiraceae bacterium]
MEQYMKHYELWSGDPYFDELTRAELLAIRSNPGEIEERFYRELEFGTGGLRGIIGAGTNRINRYTVAKATAALARYVRSAGPDAMQRGVVISYDSRHRSTEFAEVAAGTLASEGVSVLLFDLLRPVPLLSFAVRHYGAYAGIMITASHNPPKYNGYKVYGEDGGQMTPEAADEIIKQMNNICDIRTIRPLSVEEAQAAGKLRYIGEELDEAYTEMLTELVIDRPSIEKHRNMSIVYTPIHGSGNLPVRRILSRVGFSNVHVVPEQELPDGNFPTVNVPNPEDPNALKLAVQLAVRVEADLVIGTDPDCDRVGISVRNKGTGEYRSLTGNQIGLLLLDYILGYKKESGTLPERSFAVTSIVSSRLAGAICANYGVELQETLTGFKFIGERIRIDDEEGDKHFQFGFEESFGYLSGLSVRDKDAVVAVMLIAGMAAQSMERGQTLIERLEDLFERFGFGAEEAVSYTLEGKEGTEKIKAAMESLREEARLLDAESARSIFGDYGVHAIRDYQRSRRYEYDSDAPIVTDIELPESDVLYYEMGGEKGLDWVCVRPSGTEPKLKVYFGVYADTRTAAEHTLREIKRCVTRRVSERLGID